MMILIENLKELRNIKIQFQNKVIKMKMIKTNSFNEDFLNMQYYAHHITMISVIILIE